MTPEVQSRDVLPQLFLFFFSFPFFSHMIYDFPLPYLRQYQTGRIYSDSGQIAPL